MTRKSQSNVSVSFQYPFYLLRFPLSLRNVSDHFQRRVTITLLSGYFPEALNLTETFEVFTLYVSQPGVSCLCLYNPCWLELRIDEGWCSEEKVDHKIFIIQEKCNNTANIFVPEYIVVGDALTMGCAAETKNYEYCITQGMQE